MIPVDPVEEPPPVPPSPREKRALLVGVDQYADSGNNLNGCVNDVEDVYSLLINRFGFHADNIRVLTDERATKANILHRLQWLMRETQPGGEAVYYHSGHGTQVRDRNGDELSDVLDECLVPYDFDWDDPLLDDELAQIFGSLPENAYLTMICDTCHSGSMSRSFKNNSRCGLRAKYIIPPFDMVARSVGRELNVRRFGQRFRSPETQRHVLLSGCQDNETSQETYLGPKARGAMTYFLAAALRADGEQRNWKEMREKVLADLRAKGFTQTPRLSGMDALLNRKPFGGAE